tara:strand:+ start:568 stop:843 length:276 start_codon:yes stop_codon:yes gene_type:complete
MDGQPCGEMADIRIGIGVCFKKASISSEAHGPLSAGFGTSHAHFKANFIILLYRKIRLAHTCLKRTSDKLIFHLHLNLRTLMPLITIILNL